MNLGLQNRVFPLNLNFGLPLKYRFDNTGTPFLHDMSLLRSICTWGVSLRQGVCLLVASFSIHAHDQLHSFTLSAWLLNIEIPIPELIWNPRSFCIVPIKKDKLPEVFPYIFILIQMHNGQSLSLSFLWASK